MQVDQRSYRTAFEEYLRKGTPIKWSTKQARPSAYYVWRTRDDKKVRPSHAANDGRIFAWDDPPPTGNPGDDFR
jgi:SPP1 gp7 family putative phage head morphogenesis protein